MPWEANSMGVELKPRSERISPDRYISREVLDREMKHVFGRAWILACPLAYLAQPGDAYPITVGREPIAVVRGADGTIRAVSNVCRHRGRQIVTHPRNMTSLKCWFHGFEWNHDGSVRHIPDREDFECTDEELVLPRIRCETWGNFAWINLDPNAAPLVEFLGEVAPLLEAYRLDEYQLSEDIIVEWDCNWKIGCDAFQEGYHGPVTHPQLQAILDDSPDMHIDLYELHSRAIYRIGSPCNRIPEDERQQGNPILELMAAEAGVDMEAYKGHIDDIRGAIQVGTRKQLDGRGCDVSDLIDDQMTDDHHYFLFPNLTINMFAANFSTFRYFPHPSDPAKMIFWAQQFVRTGPEEERLKIPETVHGHGTEFKFDSEVYNQDASHMPWLQSGIQSAHHPGMLFAKQERRIPHFYNILDDYIDGRR
jgi:phenylpropionate dioxygenase-like ring-hydroxylating dioxygenase large terminal subunit